MIADLKPYPAMKDSGVSWLGEVPEHWSVVSLKRVTLSRCDGPFGSGLKSAHYSDSGVRVIRLQNIGHARFRDSAPAFIPEAYYALLGDHSVLGNDLLIAGLGDPRNPAGRACVAPARVEPALVKADCFRFRLDLSRILPEFSALHLTATAEEASAALSTGATRNRISLEPTSNRAIAIPPLPEQTAIVRYLDHVDRRIRRYIRAKQKLIKVLEEQKQAIIHRAVTRGLDPDVRLKPSGVEWLGDVPEHWEVWKIGHLGRVGNGSTPSRGNPAFWGGGTFPWLNSSCVNKGIVSDTDQFVTEEALRKCRLPIVPSRSVLVGITGQGKTRGKVALLAIEATINQHLAFVTPREPIVSARYLHLALGGAYVELRSISDDAGSTKGALTCGGLKRFRIAVPPSDEQREILAYVDGTTKTLSLALEAAHRETNLLQEYRTRLIADVVTGKVDVREAAARLPEEETESAEAVEEEAEEVEELDEVGEEDDEALDEASG